MSAPAKMVAKTEGEQRLIQKSQYRGKLLRLCSPYLRRLLDHPTLDSAPIQDLIDEIEREAGKR